MSARLQATDETATLAAEQRTRLHELIRTRSFRAGDFVLSSGRRSTRYFNLKPTIMHPEGAYLSAAAFHDILAREGAELVGGLEMGAVPIISALAAVSHERGVPMGGFFVRKKRKEHGAALLIEGVSETELAGAKIVVADDVATSGQSILLAVQAVREAGATVDKAIVLIDREEGAAEFLEPEGVRLLSVFRARDFSDA